MSDFFTYFEQLQEAISSFPPFIVEILGLIGVIGLSVLLIKIFK